MRLFVALTPPAEVVAELWTSTSALHEPTSDLRWTRPEQWHLTLAFLGEVGDDARDDLIRRLGRVAGRHPPLSLCLGGGGRFGNRVLWTRVHGDLPELRRLADSVRAAARRSGLPVEQRAYRPHLTLARASGPVDLRPLVERLAPSRGRSWVAGELHLVHSRLGAGPNGSALHELLIGWPLNGRLGRQGP